MALFLAALLLGVQPQAQASPAVAHPQTTQTIQSPAIQIPAENAAARIERPDDFLTLPKGKSTVMGGVITRLDPVTDTLVLHVFGGKKIRIFFDERTQVYHNGEKTSLRGLSVNERASVETMLDGNDIFARSIHTLTEAPQGQLQGQVLAFDPASGSLTVNEPLSRQPIKLIIPAGTPVERKEQSGVSAPAGLQDLVKGALITAAFRPDNNGQGVAQQISILAVPGDMLTFTGAVTYLNMRLNQFAVTDESNGQSYSIRFDPGSFPVARRLQDGARVRVKAEFDGVNYQARAIDLLK